MPRSRLDIELFNTGLITNPDQKDTPKDSATVSTNVDGDAEGILKGIPNVATEFDSNPTFGKDGTVFGWINRSSGEWDLIYGDPIEDKCESIADFYGGSETESDLITSYTPTSMVEQNKAVYIGAGIDDAPKWVGYCDHPQWANVDDLADSGNSGLDDLTGDTSGYTGSENASYEIEIDGTGTPDTFKWRKNGGTYTSTVAITGASQALSDGVTITFGATTGHTLADKWYISVYDGSGIVASDSGTHAYDDGAFAPANGDTIVDSVSAHIGGSMNFTSGTLYKWAVTTVYDGFQESVLSPVPYTGDSWTGTGTTNYVTVTIRATGANSSANYFNKRISGFKLYRSDASSGDVGDLTQYREIKTFDFTGWTDVDGYKTYTIDDDNGTGDGDDTYLGRTYEQNTGIAENIDETIVRYELSCELNGYLFTGNCYHSQLGDGSTHRIFRSKAFRYSMFDWVNESMVLPEIPKAMCGYAGRLHVFGENTLYIINPDGLYIEDTIEGISCNNQQSFVVTDYGLFWCDNNNLYQKTNTINYIGDRIKGDWQALSGTTKVGFDSVKSLVMFFNGDNAYIYNTRKDKWDYWTDPTDESTVKGIFSGKDGEIYITTNDSGGDVALYDVFGGTNNRAFTWESKEFDFDDPSQLKKFYYLIVDSTQSVGTTATVKYSIDKGSTWRSLTNTDEIKDASADWEHKKTIMFQVSTIESPGSVTNTNDAQIKSLSLVYRRMVGARD